MRPALAQFVWRLYAALEVVAVHGVPHITHSDGVLRMIAVFVPVPDEDPRGLAVAAEDLALKLRSYDDTPVTSVD